MREQGKRERERERERGRDRERDCRDDKEQKESRENVLQLRLSEREKRSGLARMLWRNGRWLNPISGGGGGGGGGEGFSSLPPLPQWEQWVRGGCCQIHISNDASASRRLCLPAASAALIHRNMIYLIHHCNSL